MSKRRNFPDSNRRNFLKGAGLASAAALTPLAANAQGFRAQAKAQGFRSRADGDRGRDVAAHRKDPVNQTSSGGDFMVDVPQDAQFRLSGDELRFCRSPRSVSAPAGDLIAEVRCSIWPFVHCAVRSGKLLRRQRAVAPRWQYRNQRRRASLSDEFDGLNATEKAGIGAALNRCRALAAKIANELSNKEPENCVEKSSLAEIYSSL